MDARVKLLAIAVLLILLLPLVDPLRSLDIVRPGEVGHVSGVAIEWATVWAATRRSIIVATCATTVSIVAAGFIVFAELLQAGKWPLTLPAIALTLPLLVPDLFLAANYLVAAHLYGVNQGPRILVAAYTVTGTAAAVGVLRRTVGDRIPLLIAVARDLGATEWTIGRRILVPLFATRLVATGLIVFSLFVAEFVIALLLSGLGGETLSVLVYGFLRFGIPKPLLVVSAVVMLSVSLIAMISFRTLSVIGENEHAKT